MIQKADLFVKLWKSNQSSIFDVYFWGNRDNGTWSPGEKVLENNDKIFDKSQQENPKRLLF